jgi:choice-of-anchor C domain-containing protein
MAGRAAILTAVIAAVCSLGPVASAATGSVVRDGDFERPVAPADAWTTYAAGDRVLKWRVPTGSIDLIGAYQEGDITFAPAAGTQSIDLAGDNPGSIAQRLPTVIGQTYTLRFAMAGNPQCGIPAVKHMRVAWNHVRVARLSFDVTGHTPSDPGWIYQEFSVVATAPSTLLKFRAANNVVFCGPALDDVSVVPATP